MEPFGRPLHIPSRALCGMPDRIWHALHSREQGTYSSVARRIYHHMQSPSPLQVHLRGTLTDLKSRWGVV